MDKSKSKLLVDHKCIELFLQQLQKEGIALLTLLLSYVAVYWHTKTKIILVTAICIYVSLLIHRFIIKQYFKSTYETHKEQQKKQRNIHSILIVNFALSGLFIGVFTVYLIYQSPIELFSFIQVCTLGAVFVAMATATSFPKAFRYYIVCCSLPFYFYYLLIDINLFQLFAMSIYIGILIIIGKFMSNSVVNAIALQFENHTLMKTIYEEKKRVENYAKELKEISIKDRVTNVYNRWYFEEILTHELIKARREKKSICLLICDIDHFKKINDTYGHLIGDKCLKQYANTLIHLFKRPSDVCARFGGDEFVVLLPDTPQHIALELAQSLCKKTNQQICIKNNHCLTTSIGLVCSYSDDINDMEEFIEMADKALYKAKENGRNCIEIFNKNDHA